LIMNLVNLILPGDLVKILVVLLENNLA